MRILASSVVFLLCFATSVWAQKTDYAIEAVSRMKIKQGEAEQEFNADSYFKYSRTEKEGTATLAIDSVRFVAKSGDRVMRNVTMDKTGAQDGTGKKIPLSDAKLKAMETFGEPLLEIKLDANGAEQSRKFLADDSALLIKSGDYQYANLFHTGFHADKKEWTEKMVYPASDGGTTNGTVKYQVIETENGFTKVEFKGLCDEEFKLRGFKCKNVKYEISGTKFFDSDKKIWTSGTMKVKAFFDMYLGDNKLMTMSGTIDYEFGLQKEMSK